MRGAWRDKEHAERGSHWLRPVPKYGGDSLACSHAGQPKVLCRSRVPLADFRMMYFVAGVPFMQSVVLWSVCAERVRR